jgi:hypothetical protein
MRPKVRRRAATRAGVDELSDFRHTSHAPSSHGRGLSPDVATGDIAPSSHGRGLSPDVATGDMTSTGTGAVAGAAV